jgi:hypothetical protein
MSDSNIEEIDTNNIEEIDANNIEEIDTNNIEEIDTNNIKEIDANNIETNNELNDEIKQIEDLDNINNDIEDSNKKLMAMLSNMFMMNNSNADNSNADSILEYDENEKDFLKMDGFSDTVNLIYDETCSITICTEQVKDEVTEIKSQLNDIQNQLKRLNDLFETHLTPRP